MDVRPVVDTAELRAAMGAIGGYFGDWPSEDEVDRWTQVFELERMHGTWLDGELAGGAGAYSFELTVPGGPMACAGVTVVGVYPPFRRRGVLTALMRAQLDDVHERGEPIAALWSSEGPIYPRFGYGMASFNGSASIERDRAAFAQPFQPAGRARLVSAAEARALFPPIWDAVRASTPGFFARSEAWWELRILREPDERPGGAGPKRFVVHETDGRADGYAVYRIASSWEEGVPTSTLRVIEALAAEPEGTRELWRFLLDIDQIKTIETYLAPVDHPLLLLLAEPRRLKLRLGDGLWVRLIDVGAALSGRGYAAGGRVVFEVRDAFCPWNEGRWRLEDGEATRTDDEPDVRLDVTALGSVFLGGFTFAELRRACRVEEAREGGVARADAMFRTDVAPWCPEIF